MESYILRVYRHGTRQLVGVLETVPDGIRRQFNGVDELLALLYETSSVAEQDSPVDPEASPDSQGSH